MYREKLKKKQGNYRWEKPSKAVEEKKLAATIKGLYENSVCIGNLCVQTKIMIGTKRTYHLSVCIPVTVSLIAEKILSLWLWNFQTSICFFFFLTALRKVKRKLPKSQKAKKKKKLVLKFVI